MFKTHFQYHKMNVQGAVDDWSMARKALSNVPNKVPNYIPLATLEISEKGCLKADQGNRELFRRAGLYLKRVKKYN